MVVQTGQVFEVGQFQLSLDFECGIERPVLQQAEEAEIISACALGYFIDLLDISGGFFDCHFLPAGLTGVINHHFHAEVRRIRCHFVQIFFILLCCYQLVTQILEEADWPLALVDCHFEPDAFECGER